MTRYRSIGERMRSALQRGARPAALTEVVTDWSTAWRKEQEEIVADLDAAIDAMDRTALRSAAGQLHEITAKRFDGLAGVFRRLLETRNPDNK